MRIKFDKKNFVFSLGQDINVFFIFPVLFSSIIYFLYEYFNLEFETIDPILYFFVFVLFDSLHVYASLGTATIFVNEFKKRYLFYLFFPIFVFIIYLLLFKKNELWMYQVYSLFSVFHFGRQQIGWMRMTSKKGLSFFKWESQFEDLVIYLSTWGFVLYRVNSDYFYHWSKTGDMNLFRFISATLVLKLILSINLVFVIYQLWIIYRYRYINLAKILIWFSTVSIWGVAFYLFENFNIVSLSLIFTLHSSAYMLLLYHYTKMRKSEGCNTYLQGSHRKIYVIIFIGSFVLAFGKYFVENLSNVVEPSSIVFFMIPLVTAISSFHHALDSFFWRDKYNPGCLKLNKFTS